MKKLFILICSAFLFVAANAQTKNEKAVTENVLAFHKAVFISKDSLALEQLSADEVTYGHSKGKLENRKQMIDAVSKNTSVYSNIEAKNITVIINGKTAVTRYWLTGIETKKDGKVTKLSLNIIQAWVKKAKHWKMMGRQAVAVD